MKNIATPPKLEIAGLKDGRDITRPFIGPLLYPLDTVLRSQNHDYKVYTALLRDSQLFSCLQQRIAKLIACETIIDAASDSDIDVAAADFLRNMLNEIGWDAVCERMLYAIFFGFSIAEIQWAYKDGHHTIDQIDVRSQERFRFDTDLKPRLITSQNWHGDELPDRKFWTLTFGGHRSDEPYGLGLAHQLYWLVYFKRNGMKSWLKFLDRFGHPLPLVKYGANATDEQKQQALEIALSLAEDSAAAAPEGLVFELVETARSGTADYTQLIALLDSGISKIILSQTMTTDSGSSRSQAEVHGSVADAIVKSDADLLSESFNRTIGTWVTELNFPGATPPRMYRKTQADQDLKTIVDRDKVLFDMGYAPNTEYIVETFGEGFRPPEKGEASPIALNGAQVTALTTTISQAISDGWIPELAVATIRASFPTIGADLITAIAEQLQAQVDKSAELSKPQEAIASPEQAAAQFGETETTADFAAKKSPKGKKDCQKGKICKGSCIAKAKTCLGDMNPAQLKAHKAAQAAAKKTKSGGGGAAVGAATANTPIFPVATPPAPVPTLPTPPPAPIAAKAKAEKVENVDVKKLTDEDGSPRSFSTNIKNRQIELISTGTHSPTWAQNDDGITVSGNKSREFMRWGGGDIYSMSSGQFRSFIDKIRADKVYDKVEEFRLGSLLVSGTDLKNLNRLEAAGLISTTGTGNSRQVFVNFDSTGKIRKATDAEIESAPLKAKVSKLREEQSAMIEAEHSFSFGLSKADLKQIRNEETAVAKKVNEAEDKLYGRKNTKTATEAEYINKAELWAKSQGFKNDGNDVNGFSAKQAAKHDIAHPATHDLVGLDSAGIHSYFGGLKTASGKKSLLGEEAIVNVMEHLSRGDTLESSVMSGTRVARMLSKDSTKAERAYVRSPKFLQDLNSLAETSLRADNFGTITKVIRESNWESGTVTQTGNV